MKTKNILLLFFLMTSGLFASHEEVVRKAFTAPTAAELSSLEESSRDALCDLTLAEMKLEEVINSSTSFGQAGAPVFRTKRGSLSKFFFLDKKENRKGFIIEDRAKSNEDMTEESRDLFIFWLDTKETEVKNISIAQFRISGYRVDSFTGRSTPMRRVQDYWEDHNLFSFRKASSREASAISSYVKAQEASKAAQSALEEATRLLEAEKELQEFLASETKESESLKERFFHLFSGKHFQHANYGYDDSFFFFVKDDDRVKLALRDNGRGKINWFEYNYDTLSFFDFKVVQTSSDPDVFEIEAFRGAGTVVLRPQFPWGKDRMPVKDGGTKEGAAWEWMENYRDIATWVPYHEHVQGETRPSEKRSPKFKDSDRMKISLTLVEGDEDATLIKNPFRSFRLLGVKDSWDSLYGPNAKPAEYRARKARIAEIGLKAVLKEERRKRREEAKRLGKPKPPRSRFRSFQSDSSSSDSED